MPARFVMGLVDGEYRFRISKPGWDVLEDDPLASPEGFAIASDWQVVPNLIEATETNSRNVVTADPGFHPLVKCYGWFNSRLYDDMFDFWDSGGTNDAATGITCRMFKNNPASGSDYYRIIMERDRQGNDDDDSVFGPFSIVDDMRIAYIMFNLDGA